MRRGAPLVVSFRLRCDCSIRFRGPIRGRSDQSRQRTGVDVYNVTNFRTRGENMHRRFDRLVRCTLEDGKKSLSRVQNWAAAHSMTKSGLKSDKALRLPYRGRRIVGRGGIIGALGILGTAARLHEEAKTHPCGGYWRLRALDSFNPKK